MSILGTGQVRFLASGVVVAFAAAAFLVGGVAAGEPDPAAITHAGQLAPLDSVPEVVAPSVDRDVVAQEDRERELEGLPWRFAIANPVSITPDTHGLWERIDDATWVWRVRVSSLDAAHLNLGFGRYSMPEGGQLYVYSPDLARRIRPFTAADNAAHGQLWTPVLPSETAVVEVTVSDAARDALVLELTAVNVGYRGFGAEPLDPGIDSGACNVDVVCPQGDGWREEIPSVAVLQRSGSRVCTGVMVNNTSGDQTPYFLTAAHCGVSSSNAATVVAYWNYETSVCGGFPDGTLSQFTSGSTWRAAYSPSDFTLVELSSSPDAEWGITFSGWDATGADASSAVAIHHPSVDEKRISFENDPTTTTSYLGTSVPGNGTHVRVADWDEGTTEGGSSGSPLYNQDHRIIGQLHGGYAACGNDLADWYGKFSVSWTGGGTPSSRLSSWLDPGSTGALVLDTLDPNATCTLDPDCDDGEFCNGQEVCEGGLCMPGILPCPGQDCDEVSDVCTPLACDNDGTCETDEDCNNCANDCISGTANGAVCGNSICEAGGGEDCVSCPQDCNGVQTGKPLNRYCCGDGDGANPVTCNNALCNTGGNTCSSGSVGIPYCCGDGTCEGDENSLNCTVDCGTSPTCGDGVCNAASGEDPCTCAADCGAPPASEDPAATCADGIDNDCDGPADAADPDCQGSCAPDGAACTEDADCCSQKCRGPSGRMECRNA